MGFPSSGERAKARRRGHLHSCATRERRIAYADCDADARAYPPVPNARLVRRTAAAAALHPNPRANRATGERFSKSVYHTDARSNPNGEHFPLPLARNNGERSGRAS